MSEALFYTVSEVCELAGISRETLYRLWRKKQGPRRTRLSAGRVGVDKKAFHAWLKRRTEGRGRN